MGTRWPVSFRNVAGNQKTCAWFSTPFLILLLVLCLHAAPSSGASCKANEFMCGNRRCIDNTLVCNGHTDCSDGADERDCEGKLCQKPHWFQCSLPTGPCLSSDLICNGYENCPGGDDERDCVGRVRGDKKTKQKYGSSVDVGTGGWHSAKLNCSRYEYACPGTDECIPLDFMCDGKGDCSDGADETAGCVAAKAKCGGFFCGTKCLESPEWVCDGVADCADGSDEHNCTSNCTLEFGKFLCKNQKTCIALKNVCNNWRDCEDGSDEGGQCNSTTAATDCNCPPKAECVKMPAGVDCRCPNGFRLSQDRKFCVDINECTERYGLCSQTCINTSGGYRCTCDANYLMKSDNRTCTADGEDALLLYTTQVAVMGVQLRSRRVYTVARNLTKVIGVSYDGDSIYWTNIQREAESIVRAKTDGSAAEILLTSGLDSPEDLAVDWLTGNIYFSDNIMHHIAACANDGVYCAVLVTVDVHQPRGIAVWPQRGQIFWTDWGTKPMIARASMDGKNSAPIVITNIHWPNGITIDLHNERIYWVDAKLATIESVHPDGTGRQLVLSKILKHPYGLAIFEDNIYWSDWGTQSIHTCNKFTGKDHQVITKDRTIYAVHIYHKAKQPKTDHACMKAGCSHLCLLAENNTFGCACPDGMHLSADQLRCTKAYKKQRLYIGIKDSLLEMDHTMFGRHTIARTFQMPFYISEMAYNNVNGSIFLADNMRRAIYEYDIISKRVTLLTSGNIGNITSIVFDYLTHCIYWTDSERHSVEVMSLQTRQRAMVKFFSGVEAPIGLSIMPEEGFMFVALRSRKHVHIDQIQMNGQGEHKHVFEDELGDGNIKFALDHETSTLYWSDSDRGKILFSEYKKPHAYTFRGRLKRPYSMAIVEDDIFWSELKSSTLHWTHKTNLGPLKRIDIDVAKEAYMVTLPMKIPLLGTSPAMIVDHPCQHSNGGCSHVCVALSKFTSICLCPAGMVFKDTSNRTCIDSLDCEFRCRSGECLTLSHQCNGRKDCPDGSDEDSCNMKKSKVFCSVGEIKCHHSEQCIKHNKRCDGKKDCSDGSDEAHCEKFDKTVKCHDHQIACSNGHCVDMSARCDGIDDCGDNSDETNCKMDNSNSSARCDKNMFQCNNGGCIARGWECDGKIDCIDGSDEHDKCGFKDCPPNMHKCLLGQCIDQRLVCDGNNDCGDHSDEVNCDYFTGKQTAAKCGDEHHPMYQCSSSLDMCLELSAKCNGTAECPRGEDEADCGDICSISEFKCKTNSQCIRLDYRCDHDKDCSDGSDEENCDHLKNRTLGAPSHEQACEANMYDCNDGKCVDLTRVCDKFEDCDTGADEGPLCSTACTSTSNKPMCEHKCRATPSGAVCSCFHGYRLDADKRTCIDIDECEESQPCAQICENTRGSYRCSCFPQFMLRQDKVTCKSIESDSGLMFATNNEVRRMSENPIELRIVWSANDSKVMGFDVNVRTRMAYFSTDDENVLYMVNMSTGSIEAGLTVRMPTKVAVDWITDNVYVISRGDHYQIEVCSFKLKMCGRVVQANPHEIFKAINVDALNRRLFFVAVRSHSFGQPFSQISISTLDGRKREVLLGLKSSYITAIAIDPFKKLLYFTDHHSKLLQSISYNLGGSHKPLTIVQKGNAVMTPTGLSIYENEAFIVNTGTREVAKCYLYGSRTCKAFFVNVLNAENVLIDGVSRQPLAVNPCKMAKCAGMCIQAEYGYECMCGNAITDEHAPCDKSRSNEITTGVLLSQPQEANAEAGSSSSATTVTVVLVLLLLAVIAGAAGYMYFRRIRQGHRDFNINLHFQNPLSNLCSKSNSNDSSSAETTSAAFAAKREKMQFALPSLHRILRSSTSNSGSEIMLESSEATDEFYTFRPTRAAMPTVLAADGADNASTGSDHYCAGDPRARLVP